MRQETGNTPQSKMLTDALKEVSSVTDFMNGVPISQVKPVGASQKPPMGLPSETRKTGRRPASNHAQLTRRRLGQNAVGLKDLLFKNDKFKERKGSRQGTQRAKIGQNGTISLPINSIQANTFII